MHLQKSQSDFRSMYALPFELVQIITYYLPVELLPINCARKFWLTISPRLAHFVSFVSFRIGQSPIPAFAEQRLFRIGQTPIPTFAGQRLFRIGLPADETLAQLERFHFEPNVANLSMLLAAYGMLSEWFITLGKADISRSVKLHVASQIATSTNVHLLFKQISNLSHRDVFHLCQHGLGPILSQVPNDLPLSAKAIIAYFTATTFDSRDSGATEFYQTLIGDATIVGPTAIIMHVLTRPDDRDYVNKIPAEEHELRMVLGKYFDYLDGMAGNKLAMASAMTPWQFGGSINNDDTVDFIVYLQFAAVLPIILPQLILINNLQDFLYTVGTTGHYQMARALFQLPIPAQTFEIGAYFIFEPFIWLLLSDLIVRANANEVLFKTGWHLKRLTY